MQNDTRVNSLSIGFVIYLLTQLITFLLVIYILIYYPINDLLRWKNLDEMLVSKIMMSYIFPQSFWIVLLPSFLLFGIICVYVFLPLHNEDIILKVSRNDDKKSLLYVDEKGKLYTSDNLDKELPGVEDLMLFKINERLYKDETKIFNDDPDWIVEDIYI